MCEIQCIKTYFRLYYAVPMGLYLSLSSTRVTVYVCDLHFTDYILLIRECMKRGVELLCL